MRYLLFIVWWTLAAQCGLAATFFSERLKKIATAVHVSLPDAMGKSINNDSTYTFRNRPLRVRTNALGDVCHIDYKIFTDDIVQLNGNQAVFDFVERYLLELDLKLSGLSAEERMVVDKVRITAGTLAMLKTVTSETPFAVNMIKGRRHEFRWQTNGREVCMQFPADVQLLLGCNAIELESMVLRDLPRQSAVRPDTIPTRWRKATVYSADGIKILDAGTYLDPAIKSSLYVKRKQGKYQLLYSRKSAARSVENAMLTGIFDHSLPVTLVLDRYHYKTDTVHLSLAQLASYLDAEHSVSYVGLKSQSDTLITGALFVRNDALGCNHVVSFDFPLSILSGDNAPIRARMYAYIPTHEVTEKFFQQYRNPSRHEKTD